MIVVDEAHHVLADSYRRVIDHFKPTLLLGVTATPGQGDGKGLSEIFGDDPVHAYSIKDAIRDGYLVRVRQWSIVTETDLAGVHIRLGDFAVNKLASVVNTPQRNRRIAKAWHECALGRPTVAFATTVQHADALAAAFCAVSARAEAIHGGTPDDERKRKLADLRDGQIDVLCNYALMVEGVDIPPVACIVMARPTQFEHCMRSVLAAVFAPTR